MSASPEEVAQAAESNRNGAALAKAKLNQTRKLMGSDEARQYLRKCQKQRGGTGDGDWYELQATAADSEDRAGDLRKADGYIHTVRDMVDYYYGFLPEAMGKGSSTPGFAKDDSVTTTTPGVENVVYGSEVYSLLNSESNIAALLETRPWRKSGERYVKARGRSLGEGGVSENAELPATEHPDWDTYEQDPKNIAHTFDVSQIEQLLASTDDDHFSDDPFDWLRRWYGTGTEHQTGNGEHVKMINAQLGSSLERDESEDATFEKATQPIDRAISNDVEASNLTDASDADLYGFDRSAGEFPSNVLNAGASSNTNFTMNVLDDQIREVRELSGKDPVTDDNYFFLTGHDTYQKIENEVGAQQRLEPTRITTGINGVQTVPGDDVGITVKSYKETPIIRSNDVAEDGISRIYLVDSSTMFIKQLLPTQFYSTGISENDDPFAINRLGNEGMFLTIQELTLTNPKAQSKAINLK